MPLHAGTSSKVQSQNIKEMMNSSTFGKGKSKKKRQQMAVAASYTKKRESMSHKAMSR